MMIGDFEEIERIRNTLSENPRGLSITEIARELGIHRTTVVKYLDGLQMKGEVDMRVVSTAKVYHLSSRIPSTALKSFTREPYLLISCRMKVSAAENGVSELLDLHDDPIGRTVTDPVLAILVHGEMPNKIRQAVFGTLDTAEMTIIVQGTRRWLSVSLIPAVCEDGRPGCAIICKDETRYKEALLQAELHENESEALNSDQTEFLFRSRPDGVITFVNDAFCRKLEKRREELLGFPYEPVISHGDLERLTRLRAQLTPENPVAKISFKAIQPDGMVAWEEWLYRGFFSSSRILAGYQAIGKDISERKHLEEQLQTYHTNFQAILRQRTKEMRSANQDLMTEISRREKLERELLIIRFVFDQASDSILLFERSGAIYRANETACSLLGYTMDEMIQLTVFQVNPEITPEGWEEMWSTSEGKDETSRVLSVHRRSDGELIQVEISRKFITAGPLSLFCSIARQVENHSSPDDSVPPRGSDPNLLY
jgi:PAS domain S-box-containing protein